MPAGDVDMRGNPSPAGRLGDSDHTFAPFPFELVETSPVLLQSRSGYAGDRPAVQSCVRRAAPVDPAARWVPVIANDTFAIDWMVTHVIPFTPADP